MRINLTKPEATYELTLSELRGRISVCRRKVQRGEVIAITYYREAIGYLTPVSYLETVQIKSSVETPLNEFRNNINQSWVKLDSGQTDCLWLTYHDQRVMGFVAARVWEAL